MGDTDCAVAVGEFAVSSAEPDPPDVDAASFWPWPAPEFKRFELLLAPPVLPA
jgi:hypothetical protein